MSRISEDALKTPDEPGNEHGREKDEDGREHDHGNGRGRVPKGAERPPAEDPAIAELGRRVKDLRTKRGWSLDALSAACGVSRSMLSQIERNETNPTLAVTFRIAETFGMSLADLLRSTGVSSPLIVVRADDRSHIFRSDSDCQIRTLSPLNLEKDVEFYEVKLNRAGALRSSPHFEGTREFLTVKKGKIRVTSGNDSAELRVGDSANYRADIPHAIENLGGGEALLFMIVIYE
jgi:transcriptional regulator with XRE-family HTH domain